MENKKKIIIFSRNNFPEGDAGAVRDFVFAKIYKELNYEVFCICLGTLQRNGVYEGIPYYSIKVPKRNLYSRFKSEFGYKHRMLSVLRFIESRKGPINCFHIVDIPINAIQYLKRYSKKHNIKLIHDSVEWYSKSNFKYGCFSYPYIIKNILNKYIIDKNFKVIAISKYLENYFLCKEIQVIRIPVILDINSISFDISYDNERVINMIYAGSPAKKDYITQIIMGLSKLSNKELEKVVFHLVGITKEELIDNFSVDKEILKYLDKTLRIYGRIKRAEVLKILTKMDFSILLRPIAERYALAGFPTKFVESLATGTPVICNITSDLGDYLVDMKNSIIIEGSDANSVQEGILKIIELDKNSIKMMKNGARESFEKNFCYVNFKNDIYDFLL